MKPVDNNHQRSVRFFLDISGTIHCSNDGYCAGQRYKCADILLGIADNCI